MRIAAMTDAEIIAHFGLPAEMSDELSTIKILNNLLLYGSKIVIITVCIAAVCEGIFKVLKLVVKQAQI